MNSKTLFNYLFYGFAVILFVYFLVNVFSSSVFTQQIYSDIVEESSVDDYITIEGIALRDEMLLVCDDDYESIRYNYSDGARIARGSSYATYNQEGLSDAQNQRLSYLNKKLDRLSETIRKSTQYDILTVEQSIKDSIITFLNGEYNNEFSSLSDGFEVVQSFFDQKLLQQEGTSYINDVINSLKDEISQIYSESGSSEKNLYSRSAGYFYSKVDGYEYLNMKDYEEPTVSSYDTLTMMPQSSLSENAVGKIQHYSYWAFIAKIPTEYVSDLYVGKNVSLEFSTDKVGTIRINTSVEYISRAQDGMNAVRFRCSTLTSDLFELRKEKPHMILKTYNGLRVNNEALRVVNGETGVYVLSAQRILFKPVEIIYVSDEFSLVAAKSNTGDRVLKAKDEIIIGGKDLFDGKIVNVTRYD